MFVRVGARRNGLRLHCGNLSRGPIPDLEWDNTAQVRVHQQCIHDLSTRIGGSDEKFSAVAFAAERYEVAVIQRANHERLPSRHAGRGRTAHLHIRTESRRVAVPEDANTKWFVRCEFGAGRFLVSHEDTPVASR